MLLGTLRFLGNTWRRYSQSHALGKGVVTCGVLWTTSNLIQQTIDGKNIRTYDWGQVLRFTIYGSCVVAPMFLGWVRLTSAMWPETSLRTGITKAIIEQLSYGPFSCACFFMGINLLEFKSVHEAMQETKAKFLPTYKVACCYWPIVQTINFSLVPEYNRILFVSVCGLLWTIFLSHKKHGNPQHQLKPRIPTRTNDLN